MNKIISAKEAVSMIKDGDRVMFGGFLACGAAETLIDALVEQGTKDLHGIIICTDFPEKGIGKLIGRRRIKSLQTSHIGTNPETQAQFNAKELDIEFNPQGTLMERVRAAGSGIGGFLTKTGVGTMIEEKRLTYELNGVKYLLETPITADFALIHAAKADKFGNLIFSKTARNSNPIMATAAKTVIVEADEIVEVGELDSECIVTSGVFVKYIVKSEAKNV